MIDSLMNKRLTVKSVEKFAILDLKKIVIFKTLTK